MVHRHNVLRCRETACGQAASKCQLLINRRCAAESASRYRLGSLLAMRSVVSCLYCINDPMYGPAVRCKRFHRLWQMRSCINVSGLRLERFELRAIMDISTHAISLPVRPRTGPFGSPVFACAGKPILHRRLHPLADRGGVKLLAKSLAISFFCAVPLFAPGGRSFVP